MFFSFVGDAFSVSFLCAHAAASIWYFFARSCLLDELISEFGERGRGEALSRHVVGVMSCALQMQSFCFAEAVFSLLSGMHACPSSSISIEHILVVCLAAIRLISRT